MDAKNLFKSQIQQAVDIQNEIVAASIYIDPLTKKALIQSTAIFLDSIAAHEFSLSQLKSFSKDLFIYWQESIGVDVEKFWTRLQNEGICIERKDELIFALTKGRFRRVEQAIASRNYWDLLMSMESIQIRFSASDRDKIKGIIDNDERARLQILQKCLAKKSVPGYQYLKFGECVAYFERCGLFDKYFSSSEKEELYIIWKNSI